MPRPPGLTTKWLRPLLCLTWPHLSIEALGLQGNILWLQVNFFSVTLSASSVQGGSGLLWTQFCSQIPQKHLFSPPTYIIPVARPALSSSCPFPWLSSIFFLKPVVPQCPQNPGQAHVMPASAPCCWHLATGVPLVLR